MGEGLLGTREPCLCFQMSSRVLFRHFPGGPRPLDQVWTPVAQRSSWGLGGTGDRVLYTWPPLRLPFLHHHPLPNSRPRFLGLRAGAKRGGGFLGGNGFPGELSGPGRWREPWRK